MGKVLNLFIIFYIICKYYETSGNEIFHAPLDTKHEMKMHWEINYNLKRLTFEIHLPKIKLGWFAFGFSDRGEHYSADYCLFNVGWKYKNLIDTFTDDQGILYSDFNQNCDDFQSKDVRNYTKYTFTREFDTCDDKDYIIEEGTTHIVWLRGQGSLMNIDGFDINSILLKNKGMIRVTLLKNTSIKNLPPYIETIDVLVNKVKVPAEETTYWCSVKKLSEKFKRKHHIYQFESNIQPSNEGVVHHMEVFHCIASEGENIPLYEGSCFAKERPPSTHVCKRVLAAWAMGAGPFTYPEEASLPIGGKEFNPYIMIEVHYNNPERISGIIDSSGIRLYVSDNLKKFDAGIMELGLEYTDKMAIPPEEEQFSLMGYCISECTAVGLPPNGITVFGSQLHTHLTGIRVQTRHFRNGHELQKLNWDNHYSTHFQEIRRLKRLVKVLPGDALITKCDYKTTNRENVTLGGFAISDEMCVNYIHYFPATLLEVCKSSISDEALNTYFRYMNDWEGQNTSLKKVISENYKSIKWNKMRKQLLSEVYSEAPLSMQCNMSSGEKFPGFWENAPLTQILVPLPPPQRNCLNKK